MIIPEIRLIQSRFFSVNLGLSFPAKNTLIKSDTKTKPRQVPKTINLYCSGFGVSSALVLIAAVQANQNKNTLGLRVFIKKPEK